MRRLSGHLELAPVTCVNTGLIGASPPPHDAPEAVWRAAHEGLLARKGWRDAALLWGRPPWVRRASIPGSLPRGVTAGDKGLALIHEGEALVLPQCCTDGDDLGPWREVVDAEEVDGWEMVWIGHPWINARRVGPDVELTTYCEDDPVAAVNPVWVVTADRLQSAIDVCAQELGVRPRH